MSINVNNNNINNQSNKDSVYYAKLINFEMKKLQQQQQQQQYQQDSVNIYDDIEPVASAPELEHKNSINNKYLAFQVTTNKIIMSNYCLN